MGLGSTIYNTFFKKTSTFILVAVGSAFFFERTVDLGAEKLFEKLNEGVSFTLT